MLCLFSVAVLALSVLVTDCFFFFFIRTQDLGDGYLSKTHFQVTNKSISPDLKKENGSTEQTLLTHVEVSTDFKLVLIKENNNRNVVLSPSNKISELQLSMAFSCFSYSTSC